MAKRKPKMSMREVSQKIYERHGHVSAEEAVKLARATGVKLSESGWYSAVGTFGAAGVSAGKSPVNIPDPSPEQIVIQKLQNENARLKSMLREFLDED